MKHYFNENFLSNYFLNFKASYYMRTIFSEIDIEIDNIRNAIQDYTVFMWDIDEIKIIL